MSQTLDELLNDEPGKWVTELPEYQRAPLEQLLKEGLSFEQIAQNWLSASAANTYRFSAVNPAGKRDAFLDNLRKEIRAFLCGNNKYKKERDGLFGEKGLARTYVVSAMAVAIAPYLNVAATVIAPVVALLLASLGKITINAWCASEENGSGSSSAT
jgi:hypothetical protein